MGRPGRRIVVRLPYRGRGTILFIIVLLALIALRQWQDDTGPSPETLAEGIYSVQRIVDGDTLVLTNQARIRLQGVDTPETVHPNQPVERFGPEATKFTQQFVDEAGGNVRLQFDRERLDKYDRFLAYVWSGERMLNEELVRAGLATAETKYRYSNAMKTRFRRAEDDAKAARRGIWSDEALR